MRSISVLKILQITMGLSGIFIVILGVGYLGSLKGGFLQLLLRDPLWAGMLTGLPLIPLIHSAKQKVSLYYYDEIGQADYESGHYFASKTYEVPVAGWLHKTRTTIFQETQPSTDLKFLISWTSDIESIGVDAGAVQNEIIDIGNKFATSDTIAEYQTTYPIHFFMVEDAVDSNDSGAFQQETKFGGPGEFFEQGQLAKVNVYANDFDANDTTGLTNLVTEAIFIVAAFDRKKRRNEERPPWVHIVGELDSSADSAFSWIANSNLRVVNLRVTLWRGIDVANQAFFVVDKNAVDLTLTMDAIELHAKPFLTIIMPHQDGTGAGTTYAPVNTAYKRGPYYLKKGEFLQFRHESIGGPATIQFQYIPDYGHTSEFNRRWEDSDFTNDEYDNMWMPLFKVPFDMYITTVKGAIMFITDNITSDSIWNVELMGFKGKNYLDSSDLLLTYAGANVYGNILGASNDSGQVPYSLKTINIANDWTDSTTNATGAGKQEYAEAIADFYPAGSVIGFWFPADMTNNLAQVQITMHIEGLNRIKTTNAGSNFYKSDMLAVHMQ